MPPRPARAVRPMPTRIRFADFYAAIRDQVMNQWESPNLTDETAVNPIVQIHVEKDGRVPPESVHLIQSSGNPPTTIRRSRRRKASAICMNPCRMAVHLIFPSLLNLPANVKYFSYLLLLSFFSLVSLRRFGTPSPRPGRDRRSLHAAPRRRLDQRTARRRRDRNREQRPEAHRNDFTGGQRLGRLPGQRRGERVGRDRPTGEQENRRGSFQPDLHRQGPAGRA